MRGGDEICGSLFSYIDLEDRDRVRADHPLRPIREIANAALAELSSDFAALYSGMGRPSVASEKIAAGDAAAGLYSPVDPVWDPSSFPKNRDRLLEGEIAANSWVRCCRNNGGRGGGRGAPVDFRNQKRSNETHRSTTDPDARLYRKALARRRGCPADPRLRPCRAVGGARQADDAASRLHGQAVRPQAHRGSVRLDQDRRRFAPDQIPGPWPRLSGLSPSWAAAHDLVRAPKLIAATMSYMRPAIPLLVRGGRQAAGSIPATVQNWLITSCQQSTTATRAGSSTTCYFRSTQTRLSRSSAAIEEVLLNELLNEFITFQQFPPFI